jgi:hypothetical protein
MPRLTYANVVATLALFLALTGGVVYAAEKIGSKDIDRDAVKAKHIKTNAVREAEIRANAVGAEEIGPGQVAAEEIADGSVGGAEVNEAGLTKVPSATAADNAAEAERVGGVKVTPIASSLPFGAGTVETPLSVGGNEFRWGCSAATPSYTITRGPVGSPGMLVDQMRAPDDASSFELSPNLSIVASGFDSWSFEITVHEANDKVTVLDVNGFAEENADGGTDDCFLSGELREFG